MTLAGAFLMVGAIYMPRVASRRQALVWSRESDRFSEQLRILHGQVPAPPAGPSTSVGSRKSTSPLLGGKTTTGENGDSMSEEQTHFVPQRPRSATSLRMTAEQTRKLSALKAHRAARIAAAGAAAQRRLVTVGVAAATVLITVLLGAFSVLSWWWAGVAGAGLVTSLVGSRIAAVNIEKAQRREEEQFKALKEQVDAQGGTRYVVVGAGRSHFDQTRAAPAVKTRPGEETTIRVDEESENVTPVQTQTESAENTESTATAESAEVQTVEQTWDVPEMPVAAPARKARLPRKQVHADTDLRGVPQVTRQVGRPLAATGSPETNTPAARDLDLDAVLEARRAQ